MMTKSDSIETLADALSKAQGAFNHAKKDSVNPHYKSKYADLASVIDAARPHLSANGLAVTQVTDYNAGELVLHTVLMHRSGEFINGTYPIIAAQNTPQAMGSAITYARRYCFAAITGIAPDDDDDCNIASGISEKRLDPKIEQAKKNMSTAATVEDLTAIVSELGKVYWPQVKDAYNARKTIIEGGNNDK